METNKKVNILGIGISSLSQSDFQEKIEQSLSGDKQIFICTPNPEILLYSDRDEELNHVLKNCDLAIPDGIGLKFAAFLRGVNIKRWPGSEISLWLMSLAVKKKKKVAVISWEAGLSKKDEISKALDQKFPGLKYLVLPINREWSLPYYEALNIFRPDIILVATGFPFQEKFIYNNRDKLSYAKILIGVGGSIDYLTGKVQPAPFLFKKAGLEWFWRLLNVFSYDQPLKRIKRIFDAIIVFPLKYLKWLYINPFLYRKNVSCLLYKKSEQGVSIICIERSDAPGHWQLPQGGTEGESLEKAGLREIQEELGTYNARAEASFKNFYKYDFPGKNNYDYRNYRGQSQGLLIAEYTGDDKDIRLNEWEYRAWKWVPLDKILDKVHPVRKEGLKKSLELFQSFLNSNNK